jgi:hypothetical protein
VGAVATREGVSQLEIRVFHTSFAPIATAKMAMPVGKPSVLEDPSISFSGLTHSMVAGTSTK